MRRILILCMLAMLVMASAPVEAHHKEGHDRGGDTSESSGGSEKGNNGKGNGKDKDNGDGGGSEEPADPPTTTGTLLGQGTAEGSYGGFSQSCTEPMCRYYTLECGTIPDPAAVAIDFAAGTGQIAWKDGCWAPIGGTADLAGCAGNKDAQVTCGQLWSNCQDGAAGAYFIWRADDTWDYFDWSQTSVETWAGQICVTDITGAYGVMPERTYLA